jgi:hypothetical protein
VVTRSAAGLGGLWASTDLPVDTGLSSATNLGGRFVDAAGTTPGRLRRGTSGSTALIISAAARSTAPELALVGPGAGQVS